MMMRCMPHFPEENNYYYPSVSGGWIVPPSVNALNMWLRKPRGPWVIISENRVYLNLSRGNGKAMEM